MWYSLFDQSTTTILIPICTLQPPPLFLLLNTAPGPCLFTHTHTHTHTVTIPCTCCHDEIKGIQDLKIFSHADSLILSLSCCYRRCCFLAASADIFVDLLLLSFLSCVITVDNNHDALWLQNCLV